LSCGDRRGWAPGDASLAIDDERAALVRADPPRAAMSFDSRPGDRGERVALMMVIPRANSLPDCRADLDVEKPISSARSAPAQAIAVVACRARLCTGVRRRI
jgi:hypothetical protein